MDGNYKVKYQSKGSKIQARFVAKRYHERERNDYQHTFSPLAKMVTVRTILGLAATQHWLLYQMDVDNAFLQGISMKKSIRLFLKDLTIRCKEVLSIAKKSLFALKQVSQ